MSVLGHYLLALVVSLWAIGVIVLGVGCGASVLFTWARMIREAWREIEHDRVNHGPRR